MTYRYYTSFSYFFLNISVSTDVNKREGRVWYYEDCLTFVTFVDDTNHSCNNQEIVVTLFKSLDMKN